MFSHIVVFWCEPNNTQSLLAGANLYLKEIPGVIHFHAGLMVPSPRPVVEQSYQVALNVIFESKEAEAAYQVHPKHLEFLEKCRSLWTKVLIYDFE